MHSQVLPDTPELYAASGISAYDALWQHLPQPSILVPLLLLVLTVFYQSLHFAAPFSHARNHGQLLWDSIIAITPAGFLYLVDGWLHPPLFPVPDSMPPTRPATYAAKSDLLRRILGMDNPGSLMSTVAHAGRKSISSLSGSPFAKRATDQPAGLGNYDNSCFQNSILQGLSSLRPLPAYLAIADEHTESACGRKEPSSAATLRDFLHKLTGSEHNGATLWTPPKLKSLDTWQQQDAQEYYSKILEEIDKEVTKAAQSQHHASGLELSGPEDDTVESHHSDDSGYSSLSALSRSTADSKAPRNPLEGLVAQRVACIHCGYSEGLSMIPFNCITLSLGLNQRAHDLYERLDSYTDLEAIQGVECAKCTLSKVQKLLSIVAERGRSVGSSEEALREPLARLEAVGKALEEDDFEEETLLSKCKISKQHRVSSTKTKQMVIARPPQSLAVHINRSVFDERTGDMFKNPAAVRFPETLDLGPWCLGSAGIGDEEKPSDTTFDPAEQWSSNPTRSMVSGALKPSKINGPLYELRAVITHQGRHENGHYVCYRRHPRRSAGDRPDKEEGISHHDAESSDTRKSDWEDEATWWRLSDESVWETDEETVLAQGGVFMLLYDCVDHNSVLDRPGEASDSGVLGGAPNATQAPDIHESLNQDDDGYRVSQVAEASSLLVPEIATKESGPNTATSSLFPTLGHDEYVDPMIPLRRPNS
ncbi:cysteine proteinase [Xylariaceae sp. FL1019]|nr:cysteine proteinase [Xylariaceae sp. FL1019]